MSNERDRQASEREIRNNSEAYNKIKAELEREHKDRFALMHAGRLVEIYDDSGEAYSAGCEKFGLGKFSIQGIGEEPITLGIFTLCVDAA